MKLVLVLCDTSRSQEIMKLLESHGATGHTEVPVVLGAGTTGKMRNGEGFRIFSMDAEMQL